MYRLIYICILVFYSITLRRAAAIQYVKITPDRYDDVIKYLRSTFFADEPLNKAVKLCKPGEGHYDTEKFSLQILQDDLSVMALTDDDEIAGVILNDVSTEESTVNAIRHLEQTDEKFRVMYGFIYAQQLKEDLFKRFGVQKIFDVSILSVNPKFRGNGIAKHLFAKAELIAREQNFKVMRADATSLFSQKVFASFGFVTCLELRYDEYCDENNQPIFEVEPPHELFKLMYKYLDDDQHLHQFKSKLLRNLANK